MALSPDLFHEVWGASYIVFMQCIWINDIKENNFYWQNTEIKFQ